MARTSRIPALRWLPCALLMLAATGPARAQGVHAGLAPASQFVSPGAGVDVEIDVTQAGSPFNGFEAVVAYDPAALTFVQASPVSLQQGCLMTGGCSAACGNTFHVFSAAADSLKANVGLLCDQTSLTGPGQIYKLHFTASNTAQVTTLSVRRAAFYQAGVLVTPVSSSGCTVTIGSPAAVGPPSALNGLRIRARPNPFRNVVQLSVEADVAGEQDLEVIDLLGRTIRRLSAGPAEAGMRQVEWDGRDDLGARAPAGIYMVRLRVGDRIQRTRVTLLW